MLPHSDPVADVLLGDYAGFKYKTCADTNTASCLTCRQSAAVTTVVSPPVLSTVVNEVRRWKPIVHNRRPC